MQPLKESSDAVVVLRLDDGLVLDVNEALFRITGHRGEDLIGRSSHELLLRTTVAGLLELKSVGEVPCGFRTRTGELRVGVLSMLLVDVGGDRLAVCILRAGRNPTAAERRAIARLELGWVLRGSGSWLQRAEHALQVVGECLRWEFGAVWRVDRELGVLTCTHVWCAPAGCPEELAAASAGAAYSPGNGVPGRAWADADAVWVADAKHGRVAVPVPGDAGIVGVLELVSSATRHRDEDTLHLLRWLASLLGTVARGEEPDDLGEQTAGLELQPEPVVLRELAGSVARLNHLLEALAGVDRPQRAGTERRPAAGGVGSGLPAGLTLKAVSERTGIPAATVRTWERRYQFLQPARSSSGYRIYGEEDLARILEVKRLLAQGVRISEAMAAVRGRSGSDPRDDVRHRAAADRDGPA
jgi:PAS domain S-box-containing protein